MLIEFFNNPQIITLLKVSLTLGTAIGIFGVLILLKKDSMILGVLSTSTFVSSITAYLIFGILTPYLHTTASVLIGALALPLLLLIQQSSSLSRGISKAILSAIFFGIALALLTYIDRNIKGINLNFSQYILGDILILSTTMFNTIFNLSIVILAITMIFLKPLQYLLFNRNCLCSRTDSGLFLLVLFYIMLTFLIFLSNQIVGAALSPALFIIPALIGKAVSKSFYLMIFTSAVLAGIFIFIGGVISYEVTFAPSGINIIIVSGLIAILILLFIPTKVGILYKYLRQRKQIKLKQEE